MRILLFFSFLFIVSFSLKAQEQLKRFEIGPTVITTDPINAIGNFKASSPTFECLNGIFFRYNKGRLGLRLFASYLRFDDYFRTGPIFAFIKNKAGEEGFEHRIFKIGFGGQISLLENKDSFYALMDLSYHQSQKNGKCESGPLINCLPHTSTLFGCETFIGLGYKLKVLEVISMSPEFSYSFYFGQEVNSYTPGRMGQPTQSALMLFNSQCNLKLHLAYMF